MIQIENTFFQLGDTCNRNCLIICDRGAMDASACMRDRYYTFVFSNNIIFSYYQRKVGTHNERE